MPSAIKKMMPIKVNQKLIAGAARKARKKDRKVVMFVPATKPCFYKMWSLIAEAERQGLPYIVIDPGQHYDGLIGHGMVEFDLRSKTAINLNIRGDLSQKSSEMFIKMGQLAEKLRKTHPGIDFIPYVNGDTLTAGILPAAWLFATNLKSIQGEAGLRGMAPSSFTRLLRDSRKRRSPANLIADQWRGKWELLRDEPFPEQWDTFVSAAGSEYFFPPVKVNHDHLVREGYDQKTIFTVGNTVVDAIRLKRSRRPEQSIFDIYPKLRKGDWLRVDIHRRGNLTERRFKAIINGIELLVAKGMNVCMVELNATKKALEHYGLRERLVKLSKDDPHFLFTPLWKEYGHVIEFLESKNCWALFTDSGSMQEEANELGVPCMTCRFNTDRPETVKDAHSNILVPPVSARFILSMVGHIHQDRRLQSHMRKARRLYGKDVAKRIVKKLPAVLKGPSFTWAHTRLGLWKKDKRFDYL